MVTAQLRDTAVVIGGRSGDTETLRDGLSKRWLVLEPALAGAGEAAVTELAAAIAGLAPETYGVVGVSSGAEVAVRHALVSPERVAALALVSPPMVQPAPGNADAEWRDRLAQLQCPTLVVFGQEDPMASSASAYRERIPNCNIAFVYDAGPDVATERPQALLNLVTDYLERRETFIVQTRSSVISP